MDFNALPVNMPVALSKKWFLNDFKTIKILNKNGRVAFQRFNKYSRGLSISKDAFLKMVDITIIPGDKMELEPNVFLRDYGNHIHMVKYCMTRDNKRCDGGFFTFTPKEWMYFWTRIRSEIIDSLDR